MIKEVLLLRPLMIQIKEVLLFTASDHLRKSEVLIFTASDHLRKSEVLLFTASDHTKSKTNYFLLRSELVGHSVKSTIVFNFGAKNRLGRSARK